MAPARRALIIGRDDLPVEGPLPAAYRSLGMQVGTLLGRHKVNIAQMGVGRDAPGGEAVGVLNLDTEPSAEALEEVRKLPAITSAIVVRLPPAGQLPSWLQG